MPSRRAVLALPAALPAAGLAVAGLTACSASSPGVPESPADLATAQAAARTERGLIAGYDTAIAQHPALAALLGALRSQHERHLSALEAAVPQLAASASPTATASTASAAPTGQSAPGTAAPPDDAAGRAAALAVLAASERTAATVHRAGSLAAAAGLAPLLASLCAAESCHADLLSLRG